MVSAGPTLGSIAGGSDVSTVGFCQLNVGYIMSYVSSLQPVTGLKVNCQSAQQIVSELSPLRQCPVLLGLTAFVFLC